MYLSSSIEVHKFLGLFQEHVLSNFMHLPCYKQIRVFAIPCVIVYIYFVCVCVHRGVYVRLLTS